MVIMVRKLIKHAFIVFAVFIILIVAALVTFTEYLNANRIEYLDKEVSPFEVVVARYNEDLSWIKKEFPTEKITVYNKGKDDLVLSSNVVIKKLKNIGRESHTYLHHIIENYDKLEGRILFLQGDPFDQERFIFTPLNLYKKIKSTNCKFIIAKGCTITNTRKQTRVLSDFTNTKWANTIFRDYDFNEFKNKYIENEEETNSFFYTTLGANFAVEACQIKARPKKYYQNLIKFLDNIAPIEGHYLERLWNVIFSKKTSDCNPSK